MSQQRKPSALIVDDEPSICSALEGILLDEGWESTSVSSGREAITLVKGKNFDLVLLDVWMKGLDGISALQKIKEESPQLPVVIMSGHGTIETAVRATKLGAMDFLEKPLSLEKLIPILEQAQKFSLPKMQDRKWDNENYELVGESDAISALHRQIRVIAPRHSWVFITGENGTGKEVIARNIHLHSLRADRPFVALNCAAIPEDLIESELFGYKKGAFTNAMQDKVGKFELAHQGTLFLDEIGDMSLKTQAKILRILQEQSFERLGDTETISINVRVIAATNKDLEAEIRNGNFREDLFYRLNVIPVHIIPLRERICDIPVLANHFMEQICRNLGDSPKEFTEEALECLKSYRWPGNVRELKNLIERISILVHKNVVDVEDLPENIRSPKDDALGGPDNSSFKEAKMLFEKNFLLSSLAANDWNVSRTADAIGIERSNLHRKLKALGIDNIKDTSL